MSLSAGQADLIGLSYAEITRKTENYSALFYHRLFERHPFVRALFPDDLTQQVQVFRKTIDALVHEVGNLASLRPGLADLARRHVGYGVTQRHYSLVGEVLIGTFEEILAERFTAETRQAWEALYAETAGLMVSDAYPAK